MAVGEERLDTAGVPAASRHVEGEPAPVRVGLVAVRKTSPAIDSPVIGTPKVVIHAVPGRSIVPLAPASDLKAHWRSGHAQRLIPFSAHLARNISEFPSH